MNSKEIVCYYKVELNLTQQQNAGLSVESAQKPLFSDEALTNQIGYTVANGTYFSNNTLVLASYKCIFLIGDDMFSTEYIKRNNETTFSPIAYSNIYKGNSGNLGTITKEVLSNGLTRKVTIKANE